MAPKSGPGAAASSDFETLFAASAVPSLMQHQGRGVVYHPAPRAGAIQAAVDLTALVGSEEAREVERDGGGTMIERMRTVTFSRDPQSVYGGVQRPGLNDQLTVDGATYEVQAVSNQSADLVNVECRRLPTSEVARDGYRRR
jgi:hypothetical protein